MIFIEIKSIKDFKDYKITSDGKVISYKFKEPRVMKTWYQKSGYENIKLSKNNKTYHFLIHRLVAEAFIPNPNNLPEVDHINKNNQDNRVENLRWCDRKFNLYQSYSTLSPVRNFRKCSLYDSDGNEIGKFNSVREACKYASNNFGISASSLEKHLKSNGYYLIKEGVETKENLHNKF